MSRCTTFLAIVLLMLLLLLLLAAGPAASQDAPPAAGAGGVTADDPFYPVSRFVIRYLHRGHPGHPSRDRLMQVEVTLGGGDRGYVAPREGVPAFTSTLAGLDHDPPQLYSAGAVQAILEAVRDELVRRGLLGVYVAPDPHDIDEAGRDVRPGGRTTLRLEVTTAIVTDVRTLAAGERIHPDDRIDHSAHDRIRGRSPFQPRSEGEKERRDLLRRDTLDEYLYRLSRHPGRRVDAAVAAGDEPGEVVLDYLVTESRPWSLYAQVSNTGTEQTQEWRQRLGLVHNQLTDNDDILAVDFMTASLQETYAVLGSYEFPVPETDRVRLRVHGSWNEFTASEVGVFADVFTRPATSAGAEGVYTWYQDRNAWVDLVAGARYRHIEVSNQIVFVSGEENFFLPHLGIRAGHDTRWSSASGQLTAEWNANSVTPGDPVELTTLGRLFPDLEWGLLRWDLQGSVYLEPLLDRAAWEDPATPHRSTLAHELALTFRGQWSLGNRLVPEFEQVIGGLYTVRGYPESILAGDSVLITNVEYRFHLPRALDLQPQPRELFGRPFRLARQSVYGRPDWDLVFKGFFDAGRNIVSDRLPFEVEETLLGVGVGLELVYRRNLNVRLDWGFALTDVETRGVDAGDGRLHFVASFVF